MTYDDLRHKCFIHLGEIYPESEIDAQFFELLHHFEGIKRIDFSFIRNNEIKKEKQLLGALNRLVAHEPLQHITGKAFFMDMELSVSPYVLIPRPETEELVRLVLQENGQQALRVLDIGTGSGCIALALKKHKPNWMVVGIDRSPEALDVANANATSNELVVHLKLADMCAMPDFGKFDIIISNPPYIPREKEDLLERNVRQFEPEMALFAPQNNPLYFYKCIMDYAAKNLTKPGGRVYFETHFDNAHEVAKLGPKTGEKRVLTDMFGKQRFVAITL